MCSLGPRRAECVRDTAGLAPGGHLQAISTPSPLSACKSSTTLRTSSPLPVTSIPSTSWSRTALVSRDHCSPCQLPRVDTPWLLRSVPACSRYALVGGTLQSTWLWRMRRMAGKYLSPSWRGCATSLRRSLQTRGGSQQHTAWTPPSGAQGVENKPFDTGAAYKSRRSAVARPRLSEPC